MVLRERGGVGWVGCGSGAVVGWRGAPHAAGSRREGRGGVGKLAVWGILRWQWGWLQRGVINTPCVHLPMLYPCPCPTLYPTPHPPYTPTPTPGAQVHRAQPTLRAHAVGGAGGHPREVCADERARPRLAQAHAKPDARGAPRWVGGGTGVHAVCGWRCVHDAAVCGCGCGVCLRVCVAPVEVVRGGGPPPPRATRGVPAPCPCTPPTHTHTTEPPNRHHHAAGLVHALSLRLPPTRPPTYPAATHPPTHPPPAASFPFFYIEPSKKEFLPITQKFVGLVTRKESEEIAPIGVCVCVGGGGGASLRRAAAAWRGGWQRRPAWACLLVWKGIGGGKGCVEGHAIRATGERGCGLMEGDRLRRQGRVAGAGRRRPLALHPPVPPPPPPPACRQRAHHDVMGGHEEGGRVCRVCVCPPRVCVFMCGVRMWRAQAARSLPPSGAPTHPPPPPTHTHRPQVMPLFFNMSIAVHGDKEASKAWGWVQVGGQGQGGRVQGVEVGVWRCGGAGGLCSGLRLPALPLPALRPPLVRASPVPRRAARLMCRIQCTACTAAPPRTAGDVRLHALLLQGGPARHRPAPQGGASSAI